MSGNRRLISAAKLIRDHLALNGVDQYCAETGIQKDDFKAIEPMDFEGEIFAIDGSNTNARQDLEAQRQESGNGEAGGSLKHRYWRF
jgi:hypothetical protein